MNNKKSTKQNIAMGFERTASLNAVVKVTTFVWVALIVDDRLEQYHLIDLLMGYYFFEPMQEHASFGWRFVVDFPN
jgi:hypothetical protein